MTNLADVVDAINLDVIERSRSHERRLYPVGGTRVMDKSITALTISDLNDLFAKKTFLLSLGGNTKLLE